MKILVYIFISMNFILISLCVCADDSDLQIRILSAKSEAIKVIREYSAKSADPEERQMTSLMADLLEKSSTTKAVGETLRYCNLRPHRVAETDCIEQIVAFCPYGLAFDRNRLIQTFVHESYHLYEGKYYIPKYLPDIYEKMLANPKFKSSQDLKDQSEKRAATIELRIMKAKYQCVYIDTAYFEDLLGYKKNKNYFMCNNYY